MNNQKGFTLLSMMLALSALMAALFLVTAIVMTMSHHFKDDLADHNEIYIFFLQTAEEIHQAQSLTCADNQLSLLLADGTIDFKQSGLRVYRQVNGEGYDIVLQHARSIHFQCSGRLLSIQIEDENHRQFQWSDQLYLNEDNDIHPGKEENKHD